MGLILPATYAEITVIVPHVYLEKIYFKTFGVDLTIPVRFLSGSR